MAAIWNEGLEFANCSRCALDLIRQPGCDWVSVPAGVKVVWHPPGHRGLHWSKALGRASK